MIHHHINSKGNDSTQQAIMQDHGSSSGFIQRHYQTAYLNTVQGSSSEQ